MVLNSLKITLKPITNKWQTASKTAKFLAVQFEKST